MKSMLIVVMAVLILINLICVYFGKKKLKNVNENGEVSDADVKVGIRYMIFAAIFSFITIIAIAVIAVVNIKL